MTYRKLNKNTHRYYLGRTSMVVDLTRPLGIQAFLAVASRDMNHHIDEDGEPKDAAFEFAKVDEFDVGAATDYGRRYDDAAYWRIRGREQQLIDSHGGAQSDTGSPIGPRTSYAVWRKAIRGAGGFTMQPLSAGDSFILTREIRR